LCKDYVKDYYGLFDAETQANNNLVFEAWAYSNQEKER